MPPSRRRLVVRLLLILTAACGGGDSTGPTPPPAITVTASPASDTLTVGTSAAFTATVSNSTDSSVVWSVIGGATHGTVSASGQYTASSTPGTYLVIASSTAHPSSTDTVRVLVVAAPTAAITVSDSVPEGQAGLVASVTSQAGAHYTWTVTGGTLASGQGTSQITFTSGVPGAASLGCTVRNLADSAVTGGKTLTVVAAPVIASFTAARDTVTNGESTTLTAVFANGTGSIDHSVGTATSGAVTAVGPFSTPYVATTFTLTVTGFRGITRTATVSVVPVNPPVLGLFDALGPIAPVGGRGYLQMGWNQDPGVVASVAPGVGVVSTGLVATGIFGSAGPTVFTASVRSPADSIVSDTVTITAVVPAAGTFTATGSMQTARYSPAVVLLSDGRVLVAGGRDLTTGSFSSAEIYNPSTGQFTATGSMTAPLQAPIGVRLTDGRVLLTGDVAGTQLYDPTSGTFADGPALVNPRYGESMVLLLDHRVLVAGGNQRSAELYDPVGNVFTLTDSLPSGVFDAGVIPLANGKVLVAGGTFSNAPVATAFLYDHVSGTFTQTGSMSAPHWLGTFTRLQDGRVLVAGGFTDFITTRAPDGEIFDPASGQWSTAGPLALPRTSHSAALLGDGRVLLVSGQDRTGGAAPFAEVFDPQAMKFIPINGTLVGPHYQPSAIELNSGAVLLLGGAGPTVASVSAAAELFQ